METFVKISWDVPEEKAWLNADNIHLALSAYCSNTKFRVYEFSVDPGIELIVKERVRQTSEKGFTNEYDLQHHNAGDLANLAAAYALDPLGGDASNCIRTILRLENDLEIAKIFHCDCNDNSLENIPGRIKDLAKAGALIAAEIELLKAIQKAFDEENTVTVNLSELKKLEEKGTDISSGGNNGEE